MRRVMRPRSSLETAFVEDHRKLTRGLATLVELVERGDLREAAREARELDEVAGPHIEFEETRFYPEVARSRGKDYVAQLYDEHRSGREALGALEELPRDGDFEMTPEQRDRVLYHLRRALDHAVSCGTLLSHVTTLGESEQRGLLEDLEAFRRAAHRWTELG
jgi:hypothetical protein